MPSPAISTAIPHLPLHRSSLLTFRPASPHSLRPIFAAGSQAALEVFQSSKFYRVTQSPLPHISTFTSTRLAQHLALLPN